MNKRILIIGNDYGLPGVKVDIKNYKAFFTSPYGGEWHESEIVEKLNPSSAELSVTIFDLTRMSLDYLIVVFSGHGGQERETILELNSSGEYISESRLKNIAYRQLNIFDCCRAYPEPIIKAVVNEMASRSFSIRSTRIKYENRISQASHQQVSLYACAIGECAHDTSKGGVYSKNLLNCSLNIHEEYKLVGVAHQEASNLTSKDYNDQHPEADIPRLLSSQQLIISLRP